MASSTAEELSKIKGVRGPPLRWPGAANEPPATEGAAAARFKSYLGVVNE